MASRRITKQALAKAAETLAGCAMKPVKIGGIDYLMFPAQQRFMEQPHDHAWII